MITENGAHQDGAAAAPLPVPVYALLADGSSAEIRPAAPGDAEAVRAMHAAMSPDNLYLRFFSLSRSAATHEASRVCRPPGPGHAALLAWLDGRLAGVASYETGRDDDRTAEVAFAVPDDLHGRGIATLLLEHLAGQAQSHGLTAFTATTLQMNFAMLRVFAEAGLPVNRTRAGGEVQLTIPLPSAGPGQARDDYLDHVAGREEHAGAASLRHLLRPRAVAVIGASRRSGSPGHAIIRNLIAGGFTGDIYPVNSRGGRSAGRRCLTSARELPEGVDLAIIAVPAAAVPQVAADCGRRGVKSLAVVTTGLGAAGADLLAICRRHGMRLAGPGSLGVMDPGHALNASCAAEPAAAGVAGLVSQSGGMGLALASHLSRLGIGISSFVSVGEKHDISSNDLLMWWDQDNETRLAVLYVESFGNPRKFARTARRVGRRIPVLTVTSEPSGPAAASSGLAGRTAAPVTRDALFGQAGIIATRTVTELTETAALLASQPLPSGNRVAVVSSSHAAGAQAAAACRANGLDVAQLSAATRRRLRSLLPPSAEVHGPVSTTLAVTAGVFRACLEQVAADDGVDAVLAVSIATAIGGQPDMTSGVTLPTPLAAVRLDQAEAVTVHRPPESDGGPPGSGVPCYASPGSAARALGHAARYAAWRHRQADAVPVLAGVRAADARYVVDRGLARLPQGGWLAPAQTATLLSCYGLLTGASPAGAPVKAEFSIAIGQEPVFGPLISLGLSGASAGLLSDTTVRLTPLTAADAGEMIRELRAAAVLLGQRGDRAIDTAALSGLVLRVSRLADDVPEIAELNLDPVLAGPAGAWITSARVRLQATPFADPFLRRLR